MAAPMWLALPSITAYGRLKPAHGPGLDRSQFRQNLQTLRAARYRLVRQIRCLLDMHTFMQ